jgi:hypothetical protein
MGLDDPIMEPVRWEASKIDYFMSGCISIPLNTGLGEARRLAAQKRCADASLAQIKPAQAKHLGLGPNLEADLLAVVTILTGLPAAVVFMFY